MKLSFLLTTLLFILTTKIHANQDIKNHKNCNITISANVQIARILEQISNICSLNIIYTQEIAQEFAESKQSQVRLSKAPLSTALQVLLSHNDILYSLENDILKIWLLETKTFDINYISTTRVGSSNTDVFFSQDLPNTHIHSQNLYSNYPQYNFADPAQQAQNIAISKANNHTLDNSKSGTKIYSIDEMNFWGNLENEIQNIAYRPGDFYKPNDQNLHNAAQSTQLKNIIINKGAGLLTLTGTNSQLERVEKYIHNLSQNLQAQVLIDVSILSVEHSDSNTRGVDWEQFFNLFSFETLGVNAAENASKTSLTNTGNSYAVNVFSKGVSVERIIEFLQVYGSVEAVSNPKVLTLNNQPAIISVGNVLRYSQNTTFQTATQSTSLQNVSQNFPSVFAGILLDVTPSIKGDEVILKINPSITKTKNSTLENQASALNTPPNLSTKHLSSLVSLKDNQRVVLGGLIDKSESVVTKKVPILGSIPLLKYLFSHKKNIKTTQEIIIVVTPTIIHSNQTAKDSQDE